MVTKQDVIEHFDRHLGVSFPHKFEKPYILRELRTNDTVVDLGCGIGQTTLEFAEHLNHDGHILGIDLSKQRIREAERLLKESVLKDRVEFRVGDMEHLDIPNESVSLIISQGVLLHVIEKESAVREMYRILKHEGRAVVSMAALADGDSVGWESDSTGVPIEWLPAGKYEEIFTNVGFSIRSYVDLALQMKEAMRRATGRAGEAQSKAPRHWCYALWIIVKEKGPNE